MPQTENQELSKALALIKQGQHQKARTILIDILQKDSDNAQAWFMLSRCITNLDKRIDALKQGLNVDPQNEGARKELEKLLKDSKNKIINELDNMKSKFEVKDEKDLY